jgi:hypothetical protein
VKPTTLVGRARVPAREDDIVNSMFADANALMSTPPMRRSDPPSSAPFTARIYGRHGVMAINVFAGPDDTLGASWLRRTPP